MNARQRPRGGSRRVRTHTTVEETLAAVGIESIAAGGSGVGRIDGMACFVPRTAPGDTAQVAVRVRGRFATGRLLQVLQPSPARVEPRCMHYTKDKCGGCQVQHMNADAQRASRAYIVRDALQRIAHRDVQAPDVIAGPSDWEYRRRLTLTVQKRGARWIGGLHPYDDASRVFDLERCPITRPELVRVWNVARMHLHLLPSVASMRVALRLLDDGQVAVVVTGAPIGQHASAFGSALLTANVGVREVWWENKNGVNEQVAVMHQAMAGESAEQPSRTQDDSLAFVQVNEAVAALLRQHVVDRVLRYSPGHVLDAYAGSGRLTELLARAGMSVTSIELDAHAVARAEQRTHGLANVVVHQGGVESLVPQVLNTGPDVIVVNPPRRGLEPGLADQLNGTASSNAHAIVYVSCDPATLARDLSALTRWEITDLRCFDMFPQTAHVETVCVLEPENR